MGHFLFVPSHAIKQNKRKRTIGFLSKLDPNIAKIKDGLLIPCWLFVVHW